jgi:UDP-N-acetylglucosamine--N-acetylmuramyl-(pentapeptide) pyrophosphoryl-undecaprenol N-acetylglucosamine transferase
MMKVAIACGGTGGHVFPGIAVAEELQARGHEATILETGREVETVALKEWSGPTAKTGPQGYVGSALPMRLLKLWGSRLLSTGVLRTIEPDVILAMGGYASYGPVSAAKRLGVPIVLHEGNSVPGKALRFLSRKADVIAVNFESTSSLFLGKDVKVTGFPVRRGLIEAAKRPREDSKDFNLLVIGGSQGAEFLNRTVPEASRLVASEGRSFRVTHIAGERHAEDVEASYKGSGVESEVLGFVHEMTEIYARTDAAIARSGASVCSELSTFGIPSLFVPFPAAADDHQTANAEHYASGGGAEVLAQEDGSPQAVAAFIGSLLSSPEKCKTMRNGMLSCAVIDAAERLAVIVESVREQHADI